MKKRLRKKLRLKEFQKIGCALKVATTEMNIQNTLDDIANLATDNDMQFIGGGLGYIIFPHVEDKNSEVPDKAAFLLESLAKYPDLFPDFVMGYLINAMGKKITENQKTAIRNYISTLTVESNVNYECDLWN
jgi:hypothetical protein